MLRNLAVLMSALVAMSAQAQDASTPEGERPAPVAPAAEGERSPVVLTPRGPVESSRNVPAPSASPAKPDATVDPDKQGKPNDCGMVASVFGNGPAPFAFRFYEIDPTAIPPQRDGQQTWDTPPQVWKAGRCHRQYAIQVRVPSTEPWEVEDATLEGIDGERLKVTDLRSRPGAKDENIILVVAERTKGVDEPNYMVVTFRLIGQDGRVALLQNVVLP